MVILRYVAMLTGVYWLSLIDRLSLDWVYIPTASERVSKCGQTAYKGERQHGHIGGCQQTYVGKGYWTSWSSRHSRRTRVSGVGHFWFTTYFQDPVSKNQISRSYNNLKLL